MASLLDSISNWFATDALRTKLSVDILAWAAAVIDRMPMVPMARSNGNFMGVSLVNRYWVGRWRENYPSPFYRFAFHLNAHAALYLSRFGIFSHVRLQRATQ